MHIRITFAKTKAMRFTSHLDLYRSWERAFRRAGLPLVYSKGYNPRPRINLASALPLGFTSQGEVMDVQLEGQLPLHTIEVILGEALPPGLRILKLQEISKSDATLQTELHAAEFTITFLEQFPELEAQIEQILKSERLPRQRRGKSYDLRPLILELNRIKDDQAGHQRLFTRLLAQEGATGRPEELIGALGAAPEEARVHRTHLVFKPKT